jgi:glycosyltransferase involved in cell wall biosynthesis
MNIWIINHHTLTPDMGGGTRHYDFASELVKRGHTVTIVASSFHYSKYKEMKEYKDKNYIQESIDGVDFIWIKTPSYVGNGLGRVLNMLSFTYTALKIIPKLKLKKPNIVVGSSVHLFAVYVAYKLSKIYKIPFVMEVRDIWPQTLIDMGISKFHPFVILLGFLERFLYKKADKIISNLPYAYEHIQKYVSVDKFVWISNGVNLDQVIYKEKKITDNFVIGYTGAIGMANNLSILVDVAEKLQDKADIFIRIIGEGAEKVNLKEKIKLKNLKNIVVEDSVAKVEVYDVLYDCDLLYVGLKDSPLYRFGISMNKIYDYMASGRPILFSSKARNNPIEDAKCGLTVNPDNAEIVYESILKIYSLSSKERNELGKNGYEYAKIHFSIKVLVDKLETLLYNCQIK